jgi:uncharacterized protein YkwD
MKFLTVPSLLFLIMATTFAQNTPKDAAIDFSHFDFALMDHFVKIRIDSVRHAHKLHPLLNDSLLYRAALDQAVYLQTRKEISHTQPVKKKANPMNRAQYYGARYPMIGENVVRIFAFDRMTDNRNSKKYVTVQTYVEAAEQMVEGWVHSPPHYKNMLTPEFDITGVSVRFNAADHTLTGVQVFGQAPANYITHINSCLFPFEPGADKLPQKSSKNLKTKLKKK